MQDNLPFIPQIKPPATWHTADKWTGLYSINNAIIIDQLKHSNLSSDNNGKPPTRKKILREKYPREKILEPFDLKQRLPE